VGGIGMVLNTAKLAIAAQQQGMAVTSHNIANVNSPYYSRQTLVFNPTDPVSVGTVMIGTGVEVESISRYCDQLLENRLVDLKSDLAADKETAAYMDILESAFSENSENGVSHIMSEFWNTWHDLSNNPTGEPERQAVYEKGIHLSERLDTLTNDFLQIENDLNNELSSVISHVGTIALQIGDINNRIIGLEDNQVASDLLDHRNALLNQLGELVDINAFELPDGSMSVVTAGGFDLVVQSSARSLTFESGRVMWESSYGGTVDITDKLTGGKIKGWLEMRDEILSKNQAELDSLTKELIWSVNYQHSQGVGKQFADTAVAGTYETDSSEMLATLDYGHKIDYTKDFKMWVEDTSGAAPSYSSVTTNMAVSADMPTYPLADAFGQNNETYTITVTSVSGANNSGVVGGADDFTFEWTDSGGGANPPVTMNGGALTANIDGMDITFSGGDVLVEGNTLKINTDGTGDGAAVSLTPTGTANSILDNYKFTVSSVTGTGLIGTAANTVTIDWSNSFTSGSFTLTETTTTATVDGMTLTFAGGRFAANDAFTVETDSTGSATAHMMSDWHWTLESFKEQFNRDAAGTGVTAANTSGGITFTPAADRGIAFGDDQFADSGLTAALGINTFFDGVDAQTIHVNTLLEDRSYIAAAQIDSTGPDPGSFGVGDSRNAIAIADLQYAATSIGRWTYSRGDDSTTTALNMSMEDFYQSMVGSIGIKSAEVSRSVEFGEVFVGKITEQRDNLSAVSLDEEMINIMKYQHAFTVASKLLSVADELLMTIINTK